MLRNETAVPTQHGPVDPMVMANVVSATSKFASDLYSAVRKRPGNLVISPYSVFPALAMVLAGARGETALQISKALHLPGTNPSHREAVAALTRKLIERGNIDGDERFGGVPQRLRIVQQYVGPAGLSIPTFLPNRTR